MKRSALIRTAGRDGRKSKGDSAEPDRPRLLSGGNPQIAKGYGEQPVRAYIAAMPGWKREIGQLLDGIIVQAVPDPPGVRKAVKYNSPLYGIDRAGDDAGWFLSLHCFTRHVKVTFFRGGSLRPRPPGESKYKAVRSLDVYEDRSVNGGKPFDEVQFADWVRQASRLPGERL